MDRNDLQNSTVKIDAHVRIGDVLECMTKNSLINYIGKDVFLKALTDDELFGELKKRESVTKLRAIDIHKILKGA